MNTRQAADALGEPSLNAIRRLVKIGVLTNLKPRPNSKRQSPMVDSREVNAVKKFYRRHVPAESWKKLMYENGYVPGQFGARANAAKAQNGRAQVSSKSLWSIESDNEAVESKAEQPRQPTESGLGQGLKSQLQRIEDKLDQLIRIWS